MGKPRITTSLFPSLFVIIAGYNKTLLCKRLGYCAFLIVLIGCGKPSTIDSRIEVDVAERDGEVVLVAHTEEHYPNPAYEILYFIKHREQEILIKFWRVDGSDSPYGYTYTSPAMASMELITEEGEEYDVSFILNGETTHATLKTNPLTLEVESGGNVLNSKYPLLDPQYP